MRAEDKELEGQDLEREERGRRAVELERGQEADEELVDVGGAALEDLELAHRSRLFEAMRLVLAEERVNIELLYLPQRETHALEALQAAVSGQDTVGEFVFAEDRRSLLEQSLAVLQQNITHGDAEQIGELHGKFEELHERLAELRERLTGLEDAQEEIFEADRRLEEEVATDEEDGAGAGEGEAAAASALDGPERPEEPKAPSTLAGPDRPEEPKAPSTLAGPERPEEPRGASTLAGPERPEEPKGASTLAGAEPPAEAERPSTLGHEDAEERGAAGEDAAAEAPAKKPWWRKPFG